MKKLKRIVQNFFRGSPDPQYKMGQLITDKNGDVYAILKTEWDGKRWMYDVDEMSWLAEPEVERYIKSYGDLGSI